MRDFKVLWIPIATWFLTAGPAHAGSVLFTAGTYTGPGTTTVCRVTNVSSRPVDVTVEPMDGDGIAESSNTATFPPGNSSGYSGTTNTRYCKFTILKGGKKAIRGSMQVTDAAGLLVVLEAH
jgi:hypothetical protein